MSPEAIDKRLDVVIEQEKVKIDPEARKALVKLSKGDMRKALNVLQPCYLATKESLNGDVEQQTITEEMIYECVGSPQPSDVKAIMESILQANWTTAVQAVDSIKKSKGLALADILDSLTEEFETYELKPEARIHLLEGLSEVEYRLSSGGSEKIQTSAAIGVVKKAMDIQGGIKV